MADRVLVSWVTIVGVSVVAAGCGGGTVAIHAGASERISLDARSCAPGWTLPHAGTYEFRVANRATSTATVSLVQAVSGVTLTQPTTVGARSTGDVQAKINDGNAYAWRCDVRGRGTLISKPAGVSTATSSAQAIAPVAVVQLILPVTEFRAYVERHLVTVRSQVSSLEAAARAGNLAGAESAWLAAHTTWLEIGEDDAAYGAFGQLGQEIDGLAAGYPGTVHSPEFTGFHRIEFDLWDLHDTAAAAAGTAKLATFLAQITPRAVVADFPTTLTGLNSWVLRAHEILEDGQRDSLSGNDDYGSHSDLAAIAADVTATREMLDVLGPLIAPRSPDLLPTAREQLSTLGAALKAGAGTLRKWQRITAATGAVLETLAPISELMQVPAEGS